MTTTQDLINSSASAPAAFTKHTPVGTSVTGTVLAKTVRQTRNYQTDEPEFWDAEQTQPKQQIVLTVQTPERNNEADDGGRSIFVKWWGSNREEFVKAIRASGAKDVEVGGTLTVVYSHDVPSDNPKFNDAKIHVYTYVPPSATAGLIGQDQAAQVTGTPQAPAQVPAAPTPPPAPAATAPAAVADAGSVVDKVKAGLATLTPIVGAGAAASAMATQHGLTLEAVAAIAEMPDPA